MGGEGRGGEGRGGPKQVTMAHPHSACEDNLHTKRQNVERKKTVCLGGPQGDTDPEFLNHRCLWFYARLRVVILDLLMFIFIPVSSCEGHLELLGRRRRCVSTGFSES